MTSRVIQDFISGRNAQVFDWNGKTLTALWEYFPIGYSGKESNPIIDQRGTLWIFNDDQANLLDVLKLGRGLNTDFLYSAWISANGSAETSEDDEHSLYISHVVEADESIRELFLDTLLSLFTNRDKNSSIISLRVGNFKYFVDHLKVRCNQIYLHNDVVEIPEGVIFPSTPLKILNFV